MSGAPDVVRNNTSQNSTFGLATWCRRPRGVDPPQTSIRTPLHRNYMYRDYATPDGGTPTSGVSYVPKQARPQSLWLEP